MVMNPGKQQAFRDYWCAGPDDLITLTNVSADYALPDVVIAGLPTGFTIDRVVMMYKMRELEDTSGAANAVNTAAADIQARRNGSSYIDAIVISDNQWRAPASSPSSGDVIIGSIDISGEANGNVTMEFQINDILVDANNLLLRDIYTGVRVYLI